MPSPLIECVPNFSEGRDPAVMDAIADAVSSVSSIALLDRTMDADHNRSVLTFAGAPDRVAEAAFRAVARAVELIDLRLHQGVHPRIGAADVVPFVPVEGITLDQCSRIAQEFGDRVWTELGVPVYLYEASARRAERVRLENIRRGQFEGIREEVLVNPDRAPDIGEPMLHPSAGAVVTGARKFLIAWNINLDTSDVGIAKRIAAKIRASSGGFPAVKALGLPLPTRDQAQVSMNLTDFEVTPPHVVYQAVEREAAAAGIRIAESELIGLMPRRALENAGAAFLKIANFRPDFVLETRIAERMAGTPVENFVKDVRGGAAAAAAGAMAASLGAMAAKASAADPTDFESARDFFSAAITRDGEAFDAYLEARRLNSPEVDAALQRAAQIPLEVADAAAQLASRLRALRSSATAAYRCDLDAAIALAEACGVGATAIAQANLAVKSD